jgi:hypothetical protein
MRMCACAFASLLWLLVGCVTVDAYYSIEVRRPVPDICFVVIQWQTHWAESEEWKEETVRKAHLAIESELERLGLPRTTIDVGTPTMIEGGSWVVVRATAGNMSKVELQAKASDILNAIPSGRYLPQPIYTGKGEFATRP